MHQVGVRQFRDELRKWLDLVKKGEDVVITERGLPVARLIGANAKEPLQRLIDAGIVTPAQEPKRPARELPRVTGVKGSISDLVKEQRR
jgi:prevent-host-death family protein